MGVRELGYSNYEKLMDPTDIIRFGKKVNYESKLTSQQVMEEHLRQMRQRFIENKQNHEMNRKKELEFLSQVKELEELEKMRRLQS